MNIHLCGAGLGFIGFGMSLIIGLYAQNPYNTVVIRSLFIMLIFYILGTVLSAIGNKVIQQNFNDEIDTLTIPDDTLESQNENSEQPQQNTNSVPLPQAAVARS